MNEKLTKIADCLVELAELLRTMQDTPEKEVVMVEKKKDPTISLEDVRAVLADLSRKGHTREMKQILSRFGASKLSDVDPANYVHVVEAAKEAANA